MVGTNERYVSDAKRVAAAAPELVEEVRDGAISLPEAKALAKEAPQVREDVLARVKSGEAQNVRRALQDVRKQEKTDTAQSLPQGVYNVLYADPPWQYDNTGVHGAAHCGFEGQVGCAALVLLSLKKVLESHAQHGRHGDADNLGPAQLRLGLVVSSWCR